MRTNILVLASQTAASEPLISKLEERAARMDVRVEFVVPPAGPDDASREEAERRLEEAVQRARDAGMEASGQVGDTDPMAAVLEAYDPSRHDEIIVSTLAPSISRWMGLDLPGRVARATNALVTHVSAPEPRAAVR